MRLGDHVETLPEPFAGGKLLGISEQLIRLRPNLPPLIITQLVTHFFNQNQQRPSSGFIIFTTFRYPSTSFKNWFRLGFFA
jgi:hypothetical protein